MNHAQGTADVQTLRGSRRVKDASGGWVETAPNFEIYRKWIENRIAGEKKVHLINTAQGAYIQGMEHLSMERALQLL